MNAVAAGALPDGTPVIVSVADGTPVGEPLTGHDGPVNAVAAGALPHQLKRHTRLVQHEAIFLASRCPARGGHTRTVPPL